MVGQLFLSSKLFNSSSAYSDEVNIKKELTRLRPKKNTIVHSHIYDLDPHHNLD